jgi:hypothetical protein
VASHRVKLTLIDVISLAVGVLGLVALLVTGYLIGSASTKPASAAAPITVTAPAATITAPVTLTPPPSTVDTDIAPAPGMNPKFAPPDGPDPDDPMYGVDVVALAGEFRTHGVDTPPEKYPLLLAMTNRHIARGEPDLEAWDRLITEDTHQLYPDLRRGLVIDVTRCWAEYVERVIARNAGKAAPPDSDDHGVTVSNRGPQPRITKHPIVTPTS